MKRISIELCDWQTLIDGLNAALKGLESGKGSSILKKQTHAYYSEAILAFTYFKDAWRNLISHGSEIEPKRINYRSDEAIVIMNSTKHFMQHLAKKMKE